MEVITRFFVEIEESVDGNPLCSEEEVKKALKDYYKVANVKVQQIK